MTLIALQQSNYLNPLDKVEPFKVPKRELTWLNKNEIHELFVAVNDRVAYSLTPHLLLQIQRMTRLEWFRSYKNYQIDCTSIVLSLAHSLASLPT